MLLSGSHITSTQCVHAWRVSVMHAGSHIKLTLYVCAQPLYQQTHDSLMYAGSHIKNQRYVDAMNMLMRFAQACDASHATSSQCKAYLGAVVVGLYAGNAAEAWATYQVRHPVPQQKMEQKRRRKVYAFQRS